MKVVHATGSGIQFMRFSIDRGDLISKFSLPNLINSSELKKKEKEKKSGNCQSY